MKKLLCALLAALMIFACLPVSLAAGTGRAALSDEDFLTVKGRDLVNRRGEKVTLRGVNVGGWLILEDWLCAYEEATDNYDVLTKLEQRFGREGAYALMNTYQNNFFTAEDLDEIAAMGFNCVRIPFWFRNFYYDDNGTKILNENGEWDFSRLDFVVNESAKRGLYVILDMHGAPGYQSDSPHSGKGVSCGLYADTPAGERYRELTDELWTAIASRYKGNPAVAMYDLLNEPMCDVNASEAERRVTNEKIYARLYDTVRAADPDHVITLECIWTAAALPHKWMHGWKNVVYQVHFYQNSNFIFNLFVLLTRFYYFDVPLMMGEFYPHKATTWENCFNTMEKCNYNWLIWTYKATGHGMWSSDWCLKGSKDGFWRAKIETGTYDEIAEAWGERLRTDVGFQDTGHYEANVKQWLA